MSARDSEVLERPAHVDPKHAVDYDIFNDPRFAAAGDPHAALRRLGEEAGYGIYWTPRNGGHWFINDYELIFQAARSPDLFSSKAMTVPPMPAELEPRLIPLTLDAPEHAPYRLPLMRAFAPDRVKAMEPAIRAYTVQLIESIANDGRCDFVHAISEPLPIVIFMRLMGMDVSRLAEFRRWVVDMMSPEEAPRARCYENIRRMMGELIEARQARREDDLISRLLDSEIAGRPVTTEEMQGYCMLLFAAGLDTVANVMAFSMRHMAGDTALQDRLRATPSRIPDAVEEFFRKFGVPTPPRTVTRDAEFPVCVCGPGSAWYCCCRHATSTPRFFPSRIASSSIARTRYISRSTPVRTVASARISPGWSSRSYTKSGWRGCRMCAAIPRPSRNIG